MIQIFGLSKCKATRAAQRFFAERGVRVQYIDLAQKNMARGELQSVARAVGGVAAVYDGGGARAKERGLLHLGPDEARMTSLLLEDAQLFRTPVVRNGPQATVGPAEDTWKTWIAALKKGVLHLGACNRPLALSGLSRCSGKVPHGSIFGEPHVRTETTPHHPRLPPRRTGASSGYPGGTRRDHRTLPEATGT